MMKANVFKTVIRTSTIRNLLFFIILSTLICCLCMTHVTEDVTVQQNLNHFRKSRSLSDYLQEIRLLLEPKIAPCKDNMPLLVMVTSAPSHTEQRYAIRNTWATRVPTLFILGLSGEELQHLNDRHEDDLIVYEFKDHYQNLTLKVALMLKWASEECSSVNYLLKTDDDMLLNPWQLETVVHDTPDADLLGYKMVNAELDRRESSKWHMPSWLYPEEFVPEYLSGNGYMINGKHLKPMFLAAYEVPLINIEDIYITYLVARRKLGLKLTHEPRLSVYRPWLPLVSSYWELASVHGFTPPELLAWWSELLDMSKNVK
ncbi:beta-1,3-galactosyltransferase 2-like isoform X1 [Pieris napi]|uniref:beta-1,3-galactosyltransferase 2-like isoform X1 n=2 Tax=Pieris napi TaxID=78633 RepID=UPI001FBA0F50|nr:beta-1,3-galactosyltransferase 2-like isoform X1 [Pieris napi]XP_047514707.1 beta-1,3-galactosyltransferase 2-like isoform X1 [Pieris napi]